MEKHFFFKNDGKRLFGFLHSPDESRKTGFLFCNPFIEEKVRSQRLYVNFARHLASAGYPVLRFDYMGYGDSEGAFEDATMESMIADTVKAREILLDNTRVEACCLFGGRLGGTIAALASRQDTSARGLLLWDPIVDGYAYIYKSLRANLAMQTMRHKKILYKRERLMEMLRSGEHVNIDGYLISGPFLKSIENLKLQDCVGDMSDSIAVVQVAKRELPKGNDLEEFVGFVTEEGKTAIFIDINGVFSWESQRLYRPKPKRLLDESLGWVMRELD